MFVDLICSQWEQTDRPQGHTFLYLRSLRLTPSTMNEKHEPVTLVERSSDTTSELRPTQSDEPGIDVVRISHKRPYGDPNFIGTYVAAGLGACSVYGAFVLPATSLSFIDAAIGLLHQQESRLPS